MKKMTIDEVAKLAYVSRSVVSRVLNNHPNVSHEARERVMRVINEYNYRPNSVARSLVTDRTFEICILAPRRRDDVLATGYLPLLLLGISEQCSKRGFFVSLSMIAEDTEAEIHDRILNGHKFDGYILYAREVTERVASALRTSNTPTVLIGHDATYPDLNSIDVDNFEGAYKATAHLTGLGHRQIGIMLGPPHMQESIDRLRGYTQALKESDLSIDEEWIVEGDYSQKSGFDLMTRWIERGVCPRAVFCTSDVKAFGALLALYQHGIAVPEQVALVGFDDLPNAQYTVPPLTTVHQPIYQKGEQAANIIINQIEKRDSNIVHANLPAELVIRATCGALPDAIP
ncbi:MAG: LacI family DNA-binding transcriptional regulator [Rhodothermales bacterium]